MDCMNSMRDQLAAALAKVAELEAELCVAWEDDPELAALRAKLTKLEAVVEAADEMRKFLPGSQTAPLAHWARAYDAAKAELEKVTE
jgi:hypothetical protein